MRWSVDFCLIKMIGFLDISSLIEFNGRDDIIYDKLGLLPAHGIILQILYLGDVYAMAFIDMVCVLVNSLLVREFLLNFLLRFFLQCSMINLLVWKLLNILFLFFLFFSQFSAINYFKKRILASLKNTEGNCLVHHYLLCYYYAHLLCQHRVSN